MSVAVHGAADGSKSLQGVVPAVSLRGVDLSYEGHPVLKGVTVDIPHGEFLGIIGPNGGGKTTLLKVMMGILKPDRGEVRIYGKKPEDARGLIGYVPQYARFDRQFPISVWDVVLMGRLGSMGARPFYSSEDKALALEALRSVGMDELRTQQISKLSGGQIQRVFIARALCSKPKLLLLDEPTASVDKKAESSVYDLLTKLNSDMTIILVSHDVGFISSYVKKVGCLNKYLIYHDDKKLTSEMIEAAYECPIDMITHGHVPHRVFHDEMPEE